MEDQEDQEGFPLVYYVGDLGRYHAEEFALRRILNRNTDYARQPLSLLQMHLTWATLDSFRRSEQTWWLLVCTRGMWSTLLPDIRRQVQEYVACKNKFRTYGMGPRGLVATPTQRQMLKGIYVGAGCHRRGNYMDKDDDVD